MSNLELAFIALCRDMGLPEPEREFRFGAELAGGAGKGLRKRLKSLNIQDWRSDFVWRHARIIVEIEGGVWLKNGGHTSGKGYSKDCHKYNTAQLAGWMIIRFTADMLRDGRAEATLRDMRGIVEK